MQKPRWIGSKTYRTVSQAIELLRAMPSDGHQIQVPFRFVPRGYYEQGLTTQQINGAIDAGPIVDVPIARLIAGQHSVNRQIVEQYLRHPELRRPRKGQRDPKHGGLIDYPVVCRRFNRLWIHDGTHRSVATMLQGATMDRVRLADLDAYGIPETIGENEWTKMRS